MRILAFLAFTFLVMSCDKEKVKSSQCYDCVLAGEITYSGCSSDFVRDTIPLGEYCGTEYEELVKLGGETKVDESACVKATTVTKVVCIKK